MHPVTKRRLRDGANALQVPTDGVTRAQLQTQLEAIEDGIRALQSTDDLGPEMNKRVHDQERELWLRHEAIKAKLEYLDRFELRERELPTGRVVKEVYRGGEPFDMGSDGGVEFFRGSCGVHGESTPFIVGYNQGGHDCVQFCLLCCQDFLGSLEAP